MILTANREAISLYLCTLWRVEGSPSQDFPVELPNGEGKEGKDEATSDREEYTLISYSFVVAGERAGEGGRGSRSQRRVRLNGNWPRVSNEPLEDRQR